MQMPVTLESIDAKLDRILALVASVPGPDTVSPGRWRIATTRDEDRIEPALVPIGRFGVWPGAVLKVLAPGGAKPESVLWLDADRRPLAVGDLPVSLLTLDDRQSAKVTVQASLRTATPPTIEQEVVVYVGRRAVAAPQEARGDTPWAPVSEAEYLAADRLPPCLSNEDVALARERIRFGRLPWADSLAEGPTAVVSYAELIAGYQRLAEERPLWATAQGIDDDLLAAVALLGPKAGLPDWDDPYAAASFGAVGSTYGRADRLRGLSFAAWLRGAWQDPGARPSGA